MFSAAHKVQIRTYLGYPDGFKYKDTRLESMLDSISPEAETIVKTILSKIAVIDATFLTASTTGAGIHRVDEITFDNTRRYIEMRAAGRRYSGRLSIILGVPIYSDYWGSVGYLGDQFTGGLGSTRMGGYGLG